MKFLSKVLLGTASVAASLLPALAGPTIRLGDYYEVSTNTTCNGTGCTLTFSPTPTDRFFMVRHVACAIGLSAGRISFVVLSNNYANSTTQTLRDYALPVAFEGGGINQSASYMTVNTELSFLMGLGTSPTIRVGAGNSAVTTVMTCSLIGDLI